MFVYGTSSIISIVLHEDIAWLESLLRAVG